MCGRRAPPPISPEPRECWIGLTQTPPLTVRWMPITAARSPRRFTAVPAKCSAAWSSSTVLDYLAAVHAADLSAELAGQPIRTVVRGAFGHRAVGEDIEPVDRAGVDVKLRRH